MTTRRRFLRLLTASGMATGTGALTLHYHNRHLVPKADEAAVVKAFGVPGTASGLVIARGHDGVLITEAALAAWGGMSRFVTPGDRVLIKPNCAFDRPPHLAATTSPEVTGTVVRHCIAAGAQVRVHDNPINDPAGCFMKSGLREAVEAAGGEVWLPDPAMFALTRIGSGRLKAWDAAYRPLAWADKVIGIPTVKTHNLCGASLAMKNWYGFIGHGRNRFHQDIHGVIADLAEFITPTLIVLDGTRLLMSNGPTGGSLADVAPGNTVAIGTDAVAIDSFGATLLGLDPATIDYLGMAQTRGIGTRTRTELSFYKEVTV